MFARRSILAFATASVAAIALAACGGSDSADPTPSPSPILIPPGTPSPAEVAYFDELRTALSTIRVRFDELDEARLATFDGQLSEIAQIHAVRDYAERYLELAADSRDFIGPINAPPSLALLHAPLVGAVQSLVHLGGNLALNMEFNPALTEDDFAESFVDLGGEAVEQLLRDACSGLQFFAAGKGVATEIVCPR
jgi:hypothetical protein